MKSKESKNKSKEDGAAAKPFTRDAFHKLLKRAAIPHAVKPAPKSA